MLILLPPSEGKTPPRSGRPVNPDTLSHGTLQPGRERVLDALVALCADPDRDRAREVLGLSPGQDAELDRNARLRTAPAQPAAKVYTGVLYDALDLGTLPAPARARARRRILVFSGLWGVVRTDDRIPAYRCPVGVQLPGVGGLAAYWRGLLDPALTEAAGGGPVLDLRSSGYAAMWRPTGKLAERTVTVRVLHEQLVGGEVRRSVVSHFNKASKGRLVRDLLLAGAAPRSAGRLVEALRDLKYTVEEQPAVAGRPRQLDLVVTEL
ncbi:peroxide stress protein YaaA [Micromonospora sp. WMMD1102]|uniref:peroxide stress protein YaaA n=1 Tax=Micromonospora sp. WMMD1102 TaxID=3016105 RepID=UPI002415859D|nr:peroxide stress protein YaaA [Micromonospora sp. WMMD1102]MDG4786134.1 peroxide stress protein YaaA [Micromonospora sp. WMMD1102]